MGRLGALVCLAWCSALWGQNPPSLKRTPVPRAVGLQQYVRDETALVALGKALFWDMQAGSDGRTACATCHFHAGADHRAQNQLSNPVAAAFVANHALTADEFPFHKLSDVNNNGSAALSDRSDVVGSSGLLRRLFVDVVPGSAFDDGYDTNDAPAFSVAGINTRRVTKRNTPTVINSVFYYRNFWDGRASHIFTGATPFGESDTRRNALVLSDGQLQPEAIHMENASLASQAVGPATDGLEMSYDGRTWAKLGKKMLSLAPLAGQRVSTEDSVLGPLANPDGRGLLPEVSYRALIEKAFQPAYWSSSALVDANGVTGGNEFSQVEFNFALFWGLSIQAYEATLVSDDTRYDRFADGDRAALTPQELNGLNLFVTNRGDCSTCHSGPEFTSASFGSVLRLGPGQNGRNGRVDTGFFRTGVRPIDDDIGLGGLDTFGNPLAISPSPAVNGTFKTPTLRNVEFTGPFFHNGGAATLEQVIDFYSRGSDFPQGGVGPDIGRKNLSGADRQALVAFLKSLTDDRVRYERAPFDHPELCVPVGHSEIAPSTLEVDRSDPRFSLSAADKWSGIPAVGRSGNAVPLQTFEELLAGVGADGSRAHHLADACAIP